MKFLNNRRGHGIFISPKDLVVGIVKAPFSSLKWAIKKRATMRKCNNCGKWNFRKGLKDKQKGRCIRCKYYMGRR